MDIKLSRMIAERMKQASGVKSQAQLARALNVSPQAVSDAIRKGKIPDRWFEVMEEKFGVSKEELCKPPKKVRASLEQPYNDSASGEKYGRQPFLTIKTFVRDKPLNEEEETFYGGLDGVFARITEWLEDDYGAEGLVVMDFILEFQEKFPEFRNWIKKQKNSRDKDRPLEDVSDGTDG